MPEPTKSAPEQSQLLPFELVGDHLRTVEGALREQVRAFDPGVEPYMAYICDTAGKRIRPALTVLVGGATGGVKESHLKLGTILELIHMATLVHDDIIDGAATRRKVATANAKCVGGQGGGGGGWGKPCVGGFNALSSPRQGRVKSYSSYQFPSSN